jgi:hypothetical protein
MRADMVILLHAHDGGVYFWPATIALPVRTPNISAACDSFVRSARCKLPYMEDSSS